MNILRVFAGQIIFYADGKVVRGMEMLQMFPIVPGETVMVGDTLHDAEVAETLGF